MMLKFWKNLYIDGQFTNTFTYLLGQMWFNVLAGRGCDGIIFYANSDHSTGRVCETDAVGGEFREISSPALNFLQ